jgi:hypothetical protein
VSNEHPARLTHQDCVRWHLLGPAIRLAAMLPACKCSWSSLEWPVVWALTQGMHECVMGCRSWSGTMTHVTGHQPWRQLCPNASAQTLKVGRSTSHAALKQ